MFNQKKPNGFVRSARYIGVSSRPTVGRVVTDAATHVVGIVGMEGLKSGGRGIGKVGKRMAKSPAAKDLKSLGRNVQAGKLASSAVSAIALTLATDAVRTGITGARGRYQGRPAVQRRAARRADRRKAA